MNNILFFTSTPYHLYLSFLIIKQKGYQISDCFFVIQHNYPFSKRMLPQVKNITLIRGNLDINNKIFFFRYIETYKLIQQIRIITKQDYSTLYVFNDTKMITQFVITTLKKQFNTLCCYVEDGTAIYTNIDNLNSKRLSLRKQKLKNTLKKVFFGKDFFNSHEEIFLQGTYSLIDQIYANFPEYVTRAKKIFEIGRDEDSVLQKFYPEVYFSLIQTLECNNLEELSLFFCPLIETSDKGILLQQIKQLIIMDKFSKRILIKNHPRQDSRYLDKSCLEELFISFGINPLVLDQTISAELIFEFLKSNTVKIRNVISGPSTSLITARKILSPNQVILVMLEKGKFVSQIYSKLNIECIYYEG